MRGIVIKAMDESPRIVPKRPHRLSITKAKKVSDSPTTPCRVVGPQSFNTPPSGRLNGASHLSYSTPVNQRIRTHFFDESPSQDDDTDAICSQDDRENILDVGWKWDAHAPNIAKKIIKIEPKRVMPGRAGRSHRSPHILRESGEKKGFYKFKEELSKLLSNGRDYSEHDSSSLDDTYKDDTGLAFTQIEADGVGSCSVFQIIQSVESKINSKQLNGAKVNLQTTKEINPLGPGIASHVAASSEDCMKENEEMHFSSRAQQSVETNYEETVRKLSFSKDVNLFDQSDLDNLLLQCSQKVEANYCVEAKKSKVETNSFFGNDSFDDLFLSVPVDDKLVHNVPQKNCRSPLVRHHSMPSKSPVSRNVPLRVTNTLVRHNSMPSKDNQEVEAKSSSVCSKSSSTESVSTEKRRCTAEEIERKRLEALQRRQASKLKKLSSCPASAANSLHISKVKR